MVSVSNLDIRQKGNFEYTSPSALPRRSAEEKRDHGCIEDWKTVQKGKRKGEKYWGFTGKYCRQWEDPDEKEPKKKRCVPGKEVPDPYCGSTTPPCSAERLGCPVQLIYLRGKPHLRFCQQKNERGYVVPVSSAEQAQRKAAKACKNWKRLQRIEVGVDPDGKAITEIEPSPPRFFERNAPDIVAQAKKTLPATGGLAQAPKSIPIIVPILSVLPLLFAAWARR
jgi:hypothetical protein